LREHECNISHLVELISLFGDFKNFPKKFKEIFSNYIRTEFNNATTNNKIQIIPPNSSLTTHTGGYSMTNSTNDFQPANELPTGMNLFPDGHSGIP
jgi:hypothetical protein